MIKSKIYELKIDEEDEISGIDSISLVDDPAIEINWVAFKKTEESFLIPDGEDENYLKFFENKGELEENLLNEGWEPVEENFLSSSPNDPSELDTKEYLVRYKYVLNPQAAGAPIKETTRDFCKHLLNKNFVYRIEDLFNIQNDTDTRYGSNSAIDWRGGFNCRHIWQEIKYRKNTDIVNKGSVRKGRVDDAESYDILGDPQNDTRTAHPSFSKEQFEKVSIDYDDTLNTPDGKLLAKRLLTEGKDVYVVTRRREEMLGPVKELAKELGIDVSHVHATNGKLKWETIKRLGIQKHYDNNPDEIKAIKLHLPTVQAIKFDYDVSGLPAYVDPGISKKIKCKNCGWEWEMKDGGVDPYVCHKCGYDNSVMPKSINAKSNDFNHIFYFQKDNPEKLYFATDSEKRIVLGPAMIPNQNIYRKDDSGNPYYVFFSPATIKMIAEKYMRNKYTDNNDQMHDGKAVKDVYVVESWIKESDNDKSTDYGYGDLPIGTWFVSMKVNNSDIWAKVKEGFLNGFSVSGYFEQVAAFAREEMFLQQVAEILKKY